MIQQPQTTQLNSRSLLISGLSPSGEAYNNVVDADSSYDFKITAGVAVTALGDDTDHGFIGAVSVHHIIVSLPAGEKA